MFGVRVNNALTKSITSWIVIASGGVDPASVIVKEVQCQDENCVPVETLIIIFSSTSSDCLFKGKIFKPMSEVLQSDVTELNIKEEIELSARETNWKSLVTNLSEHINQLPTFEDKQKCLNELHEFIRSTREQHGLEAPMQKPAVESIEVKMKPRVKVAELQVKTERPPIVVESSEDMTVRHKKGTRARGCPCCDPDNIENQVDQYLFLQRPP